MKETAQKSFRTYTTLFILPQLGFKKEHIINKDFVNSYLYLDTHPEEEGYVYIVHKAVVAELAKAASHTYVSKEDIIYAIPIPEELNYFIRLFYKGLYSKFLPSQKLNVLSFWGLSKHSRMHNILNPKDYLYELSGFNTVLYKKGEVWPRPNTLNETYISNQN